MALSLTDEDARDLELRREIQEGIRAIFPPSGEERSEPLPELSPHGFRKVRGGRRTRGGVQSMIQILQESDPSTWHRERSDGEPQSHL